MINLATPTIHVGRYVRGTMAYAIDHLPQNWREHPMEPALDVAFFGGFGLLGLGAVISNPYVFSIGASGVVGGCTLVVGKYFIDYIRR